MSLALVRYVLRAAIRDRLIISLLIVFLVGTSLAIFMGTAAVAEKGEFAIVFAGAGLRVAGVLGLVLFVVFHIRRSFDTKDVEFLLARPVSRAQFLLSFACAFSLLGALAGLTEALCIYMLAPGHFGAGALLWMASIMAENIIMVNVALFLSMIVSGAAAGVMASAGLYILGRMMGELLGIVDLESDIAGVRILGHAMEVISSITPRLDLFGQTTWLVYGPGASIGYGFIVLQCVIFSAMILAAALIDLARKKF